jgi:hypothetical protein
MKLNLKNITLALLLFANATNFGFAQEAKETAIDISKEPEAIFVLEINGQKVKLKQGEVTEVKGEFKNPKVSLSIEPFKEFAYGGIYVKYPQHFGFEADVADENVKMWNLSGNSGILMIQKYSLEMDHKTMAQLLVPRYGEDNARLDDCSMKFMGKMVAGTRVIATFGGTAISQEVYSFKLANGSVLLIIQDGIDENGNHTREGLALKEIISDSFKLTK